MITSSAATVAAPQRSRSNMTPTAGKFQPPGAPVSGRNTGRRGVTPRSACKTAGGGGGAVVKPKSKLTAEQQLEIIQRLRTGNYKRGVGISQFYEEAAAEAAKPKCRQNLYSSFALVDPLATSTKNYGNDLAGSMESLSMTSSVISSGPSTAEQEMMSGGVSISSRAEVGRSGEYKLPEYVKVFDSLMSTKECHFKSMQELVDLVANVKLARLIPQQKMTTFFRSIEGTYRIIQKFLNGNASENMQLFLPDPPTKGPPPTVIHCDVGNQSEFIEACYKMCDILDRLDRFIKQEPKDFKLEAKTESLKDMVNNLEEHIKAQEQYVVEMKELMKKMALLNHDSILSDAGIEGLEDASL